MTWNRLSPILKTTGRPMTSASIVVNKGGVAKISLVLSGTIHGEYGDRTKVNVSAGEGEHEGALLIEFDPKGAFDVKQFGKGGGRLFIPCGPGIPTGPTRNEPCTLGERTKDCLVVNLPVEAWRREIAARAGRPAAVASSPQVVKPPLNGAMVDMVDYLSGKGVKISRLAGGRFAVDGETLQAGQVLALVNAQRNKADLDPLPSSKAW